ncbi:hypothetical protein BD779DRAFT_1798023 [Infundibulicybe gibba]|nr:hypothetical protein BD779DRAFT_1798023 [Infundibulicybe gibba]
MSSIDTINHENVVAHAKDVLKPIKCDWQLEKDLSCPVILGSWSLLRKHQLKHCKFNFQVPGHARGMCKLPRCNIRVHASIQLLQEHIEVAHLSRVPLPCPIKDCTLTFARPNQLIDHFHDTHKKSLENLTRVSSGLIQQSWQPFIPTMLPPPPLPICDYGLLGVKVPRYLVSPASGTSSLAPLQAAGWQVQPPSFQKRRMEKKLMNIAEDMDDNQQGPSDFPTLNKVGNDCSMSAIIWKKPSQFKTDVARPRNMALWISPSDPPISIHYKVFAEQVIQGLEGERD